VYAEENHEAGGGLLRALLCGDQLGQGEHEPSSTRQKRATPCRAVVRNRSPGRKSTQKNDTEPKNSAQKNENSFSTMMPRPTKIETETDQPAGQKLPPQPTKTKSLRSEDHAKGKARGTTKMQNMIFLLKSTKLQLIHICHRCPSLI
jgi:hypothetical protein